MNKIFMALNVLLFGWGIGLGLRFLVEFLIKGNTIYMPNVFDLAFDWSGLLILAFLNFTWFTYEFYKAGKHGKV